MNWVNLGVAILGIILFAIIILLAREEAKKGFKKKRK